MAETKRNAGYLIREAVIEDLPVLVDFLARLALHVAGSPPQALKESEHARLIGVLRNTLASPDKRILVADVIGAGLVGMGDIYVWSSQGIWEQAQEVEYRSAVIDDIWVEPDYRNLGIFKALLSDLVAFADRKGAQELILEYSASNKEAEIVWSRLGFKPTGVRAAAFTQHVKEALA